MSAEHVDCCVVGGGPAGMMTGLLLARQGVKVLVLEKHRDFLRDFRGDTVHPSTLKTIEEIGAIDDFLKIRHVKAPAITMAMATGDMLFADFAKLPGRYPYLAFMPQWDVLNFLATTGRSYPGFQLLQEATVTRLAMAGERITGVVARTPTGPIEVRANLVIAADGRNSVVRAEARMELAASAAPMDVLWFRLSRVAGENIPTVRSGKGFFIVCINRDRYWQIAYMIPKGRYGALRDDGVQRFRDAVGRIYPAFTGRLSREIQDWDDIKPLDVRVDRLRRWYRPGLLCIGDAAHAMSPAGGVGINLAVQDAVATARILGPALRAGRVPSPALLRRVQRRRQFPARVVQLMQLRFLSDLYPSAHRKPTDRPMVVVLTRLFPPLPRIMARIIGLGVRPERVSELSVAPLVHLTED